jgi:hypothetical protein
MYKSVGSIVGFTKNSSNFLFITCLVILVPLNLQFSQNSCGQSQETLDQSNFIELTANQVGNSCMKMMNSDLIQSLLSRLIPIILF